MEYISTGGCNRRLCRSAQRLLRRMTVARYPLSGGEPDLTQAPANGWVCGFITRPRPRTGTGLRVEGRPTAGADTQGLTVAACSLGGLRPGDRVTVGEAVYRVYSVEGRSPEIARLLPADD